MTYNSLPEAFHLERSELVFQVNVSTVIVIAPMQCWVVQARQSTMVTNSIVVAGA